MIEGRRVVAGDAILSGLAAGESTREEVFEALVRDHSRLVYRIAYAVLRRHHDAEDATQETFMRVLRYSSKLDKVDNPKTWLARIAWRVAIDRSRHLGKRHEIPLDNRENPVAEIVSADIPADQMLQGNELSSVIQSLIAALAEKLRAPLILSALQEMSPQEVATTLNISEAAVRSRVFRARALLREKLAQQMANK